MATKRTKVRRHPERGAYDRATIYAILDEALICHLGFVVDVPNYNPKGHVFEQSPQPDEMIPKGSGSENNSWLRMAIPAEGVDAIKRFVVDCVIAACALLHDLTVLHRDRHYGALAKISALRVRDL